VLLRDIDQLGKRICLLGVRLNRVTAERIVPEGASYNQIRSWLFGAVCAPTAAQTVKHPIAKYAVWIALVNIYLPLGPDCTDFYGSLQTAMALTFEIFIRSSGYPPKNPREYAVTKEIAPFIH
jgi:hypothetical protein